MKYMYPALIRYDIKDKCYYVNFPDMSNVFTDGDNIREALDNADDVLNLMLWSAEYDGDKIPPASNIQDVKAGWGEVVVPVFADTEAYSAVMVRENPDKHYDLSRIKKEQEAV